MGCTYFISLIASRLLVNRAPTELNKLVYYTVLVCIFAGITRRESVGVVVVDDNLQRFAFLRKRGIRR